MVPKERLPPIHRLLNRSPSKTNLPLTAYLPLRTRNTLVLDILNRDEHLLRPDQISCEILLETTRHKSAGCIAACEEIVAPAGSVDGRVRGDVEDRPVDDEIDREGWIGAVVEGEFGGSQINWAGLGEIVVLVVACVRCSFEIGDAPAIVLTRRALYQVGFHNRPASEPGPVAP